MKSQKGVTLISLTVYIIGFTVLLGIVITVSNFFYKNVDITTSKFDYVTEYTKFNSFFTREINAECINVLNENDYSNNNSANHVIFKEYTDDIPNGYKTIQYIFNENNHGIYRIVDVYVKDNEGNYTKDPNQTGSAVKICRNVERCSFSVQNEDGKVKITVNIQMKDDATVKTYSYTLRN